MNREEFLSQLERLLYDIPAQEREEALEYYNGYFDDAGKEKEAEVIQELGSPGKVAAIIKAEKYSFTKQFGAFFGETEECGENDTGKLFFCLSR